MTPLTSPSELDTCPVSPPVTLPGAVPGVVIPTSPVSGAVSSRVRSAPRPRTGDPTTIWLIDQPECAEWDEYVATRSDCAYATMGCRARLVDSGAGTPYYLAAIRGRDFVGILPLFECMMGRVRRLVSLPAVPFGGLFAGDQIARDALLSRAAGFARARGIDAIVVRGRTAECVIDTAAAPPK